MHASSTGKAYARGGWAETKYGIYLSTELHGTVHMNVTCYSKTHHHSTTSLVCVCVLQLEHNITVPCNWETSVHFEVHCQCTLTAWSTSLSGQTPVQGKGTVSQRTPPPHIHRADYS